MGTRSREFGSSKEWSRFRISFATSPAINSGTFGWFRNWQKSRCTSCGSGTERTQGSAPSRRVWVRAIWEARDLAAGNSQWFIKHTVPLALNSLEQDLYGNGLTDPTAYDEVYERELLVELVERRIEEDHRDEIRKVFTLLRQGYTWDEIATYLHDPKPEALKKRFWRWIKQNFPQKPKQNSLHSGRHMP